MPSKRTWASLRNGPLGNPMRSSKIKCKVLYLCQSIHAGNDQIKNSLAEKDLGVLVGEEDEHDPEMCTHSPDRQSAIPAPTMAQPCLVAGGWIRLDPTGTSWNQLCPAGTNWIWLDPAGTVCVWLGQTWPPLMELPLPP
ncbi:hypothetical protein TURU_093427 [Turdus rufiventris]|nr:hypothetical protein TURU_093427 [Turdus rufiventris]